MYLFASLMDCCHFAKVTTFTHLLLLAPAHVLLSIYYFIFISVVDKMLNDNLPVFLVEIGKRRRIIKMVQSHVVIWSVWIQLVDAQFLLVAVLLAFCLCLVAWKWVVHSTYLDLDWLAIYTLNQVSVVLADSINAFLRFKMGWHVQILPWWTSIVNLCTLLPNSMCELFFDSLISGWVWVYTLNSAILGCRHIFF